MQRAVSFRDDEGLRVLITHTPTFSYLRLRPGLLLTVTLAILIKSPPIKIDLNARFRERDRYIARGRERGGSTARAHIFFTRYRHIAASSDFRFRARGGIGSNLRSATQQRYSDSDENSNGEHNNTPPLLSCNS